MKEEKYSGLRKESKIYIIWRRLQSRTVARRSMEGRHGNDEKGTCKYCDFKCFFLGSTSAIQIS